MGKYGEGLSGLVSLFCFIPNTCHGKGVSIIEDVEMRVFLGFKFLPFEISIRWYEASALLDGVLENRFFSDSFDPCVDWIRDRIRLFLLRD